MVVVGKLFGNCGSVLLLSHKEPPLSIAPGSKVLDLQFSQGLHHPRDEDLVLHLLHCIDLGLCPIIDFERHKSWDGP